MTYASGALHRFGHVLQVSSRAASAACFASGGAVVLGSLNRACHRLMVSGPFLGFAPHKSFSHSVDSTSPVVFNIASSPRKQFAICSQGLSALIAKLGKLNLRKPYARCAHLGLSIPDWGCV